MKTIYGDFIICIVSLTILHPHFSIRILTSAFIHLHFIVRIFPSVFYHPHFSVRHPPSATIRPLFTATPSAAIRPLFTETPLSPASFTRKLLCLFCREKFCTKTFYSGIELICEFAKQCFIITKILFFDSFLLFLLVWLVCKSF